MPEHEIFRDAEQAPELVAIPAGFFLMGSPDDEAPERYPANAFGLRVARDP